MNVLLLAVLVSTVIGVVWMFRLDYEMDLLRSRQLKGMSDEQDGRAELKEYLTKTPYISKLPDDLNSKLDNFGSPSVLHDVKVGYTASTLV